MKFTLHIWVRCAAILPACFLAACGGVRLQSLDQATKELTSSLQRDARQECQKSSSTTDYMTCIRQVDKTYDQFRQEKERQKPAPVVIQRPTSAAADASPPPSIPK